MNPDKLLLLRQDLADLDQAAAHLEVSLGRTQALIGRDSWSIDELERLDSLTSRFARLADLLTQRVMRLVDDLELTPSGTLIDRFNRAEKRGWTDSAVELRRIRELRNMIAHEYAADRLAAIYAEVFGLAPRLLAVVPKVRAYAEDLLRQLEGGKA
ncbi:hypothetical protein RHDC4_00389 [Rhodocyclaceae bacterium]|nr:hypothetical protein RHDC4_00389 [Rhodocyclaceae bacterium]